MTPADIKTVLLWSLVINYGLLSLWFSTFVFGHDALFELHRRWFRLSLETFDTIHYAGMALYKIGIFLLNVAPLLALVITRQ